MKTLNAIALTLVIVGAINWGLVGLANFDLVATIAGQSFGDAPNMLRKLVYILVGLAGLYSFVLYPYINRDDRHAAIAR